MSFAADLVTTLAPVFDGRFYLLVAPAKVVEPYAVYQLVSGNDEAYLDNLPNLNNSRYQVTMFGRDATVLEEKVEDSKAAMLASTLFKSICINELDAFEDAAQLYGKQLDFSMWQAIN